jgi:hypothetical protein
MPRYKRAQKLQMPASHQSQTHLERPPKGWWTRARLVWGLLVAVCAAIVGVANFAGPFWPTIPDIHPGSEPSSSDFIAPFVVRNRSILFSMEHLLLDCRIRDVAFENIATHRWVRMIVTSDFSFGSMAQPTTLLPQSQKQFPCSAENGLRDPQITIDGTTVKLETLKGVTVRITAQWKINFLLFNWTRTLLPLDFSLVKTSNGMSWLEGEILH